MFFKLLSFILQNKERGHNNENESAYLAAVVEISNVLQMPNVFSGISLTIIGRENTVIKKIQHIFVRKSAFQANPVSTGIVKGEWFLTKEILNHVYLVS